MKNYFGNYLGMVINNNDPEYRGRIQVFIPHIMPTLYENWNEPGENIQINCVGDNMAQGLTEKVVSKLKLILPWAEAASPIVGQGVAGSVWTDSAGSTAANNGAGSTAANNGAGSTAANNGAGSTAANNGAGSTAANNDAGSTAANNGANQNTFDQTPTAQPAGSLPPGDKCDMPKQHSGVLYTDLKPGFVQRLNGLYREGTALGYKIGCQSAYRSTKDQQRLYARDLARHGGKPSGYVGTPGFSSHEFGIAVDLHVQGNGVSITHFSGEAERAGLNKDTPEWHTLLAKYGLHASLHPRQSPKPGHPESWHVEPIEMPKANAGVEARRKAQPIVASKMSTTSNKIGETTSSSQMPAMANPLKYKDPPATELLAAASATTGASPSTATQNSSSSADLLAAVAATPGASPSTATQSVSSSPSTPTQSSSSDTSASANQLAKDRTSKFRHEINDPRILDRIEYLFFVQESSGNVDSASLIFETAVNRAYFRDWTLQKILFSKYYAHDATSTKRHGSKTLEIVRRVIFNGQNLTNLATDNGSNERGNHLAGKRVRAGCTGSWFDLKAGKKITDNSLILKLLDLEDGSKEFLYRSDAGIYTMDHGKKATIYAKTHNIVPSTPSTFNANTPLPEDLAKARSSPLTGNETGALPSPSTVNNVDNHGPTIVKNTNDTAKGMFAFPGVGAMVWVFFREGNPLFPVYFAASYSSGEWKSAYSAGGISPTGDNQGNVGPRAANSMKLHPNAGGGLEFSHVKDATDPSGAHDKAVAMIYGDDGSNMVFTKGYHQLYTRHDRRDQVDGHMFSIVHGSEERWIDNDSNTNVRGNVFIKVGKIDSESMEAMKELSDFSTHLNNTLMLNKTT